MPRYLAFRSTIWIQGNRENREQNDTYLDTHDIHRGLTDTLGLTETLFRAEPGPGRIRGHS